MLTYPAKQKIALGVSGGVDSAVVAHLLKEAGHDVTAVFMQCWDSKADGCTVDEDKSYAVQTAGKLGLKFEHLDFVSQYKAKVIDYFYLEYQAGRTPNPDVMCNKEVKFGLFYNWAMANGFDYVATGHYARIGHNNGQYQLLRGVDVTKDQSYFLYLLDQQRLSHTLFPIGNLKKTQVRDIAKKQNLPPADRPESMGICFIGEVDIKEFLKKRINVKQGLVKDTEGNIIGTHDGVWFYTIGQRHGFIVNKYRGIPMYVISKDVSANELIVGEEDQACVDNFNTQHLHWIDKAGMDKLLTQGHLDAQVRVRHLGKLYPCVVELMDNDTVFVRSCDPIFGVAPGQSAVFYNEDCVLGGGIITQTGIFRAS